MPELRGLKHYRTKGEIINSFAVDIKFLKYALLSHYIYIYVFQYACKYYCQSEAAFVQCP